jgi:hypothetical protein
MQELTAGIREQGQRRRILVSLAAMCAHQPDLDRAGEVRCEDLYTSGALQAAAARPSSVAEPRTAGASASQRLPAARPRRRVDALL